MADWVLVRTSDGVCVSRESGPPPSVSPIAGHARRFLTTAQEQSDFSALFLQAEKEGRNVVLSGNGTSDTNLTHDWPEYAVAGNGELFKKVIRKTLAYPGLSGGTFALSSDSRPLFRVELSKTEMTADGTDSVTVTVSRVNASNVVQTGFAGTFRLMFQGRRIKLVFASGVATFSFKTRESGTIMFRSTPAYKLIADVTLEADD